VEEYPPVPTESSPPSIGEFLTGDPRFRRGSEDHPTEAPLVYRCISARGTNRNPVLKVEIFNRGVRLVRETHGEQPPAGKRSEISSFTPGSKRRLRWAASNAYPELITTFGMTYHKANPQGRECKKHLHAFIEAMRRAYPQIKYLWILEFQKRAIPHFHIWLTVHHETPGLQRYLAETWHRIAEPESPDHLWWHLRGENFIPWKMDSGSYLCKYLDKCHQKNVPPNFTGIGRFWGASHGIVPSPVEIPIDEVPAPTLFVRTLCRHQETTLRRQNSKRRFHHQARRSSYSHRLPNAANVAIQLLGALSPTTPLQDEPQPSPTTKEA